MSPVQDEDANDVSSSTVVITGSPGNKNICSTSSCEMDPSASLTERIVNSLTSSYPSGSALSKSLRHVRNGSDNEQEFQDVAMGDSLSLSCFAELRLDKCRQQDNDDDDDDMIGKGEDNDDELTDLDWLQNRDLLKNIETGDRSLCTSPTLDDHLLDDTWKENDNFTPGVGESYRRPAPPIYNPLKHINSKPPYSFSCLIFMSIEAAPSKRLPVKEIYSWIQANFPFFRSAPTGWKNSVRHNLSLNKCFMKVDKDHGQGIGKGSYWCVDPNYRPNLLQALRRTPYHPFHQMQMISGPPSSSYSTTGSVPAALGTNNALGMVFNVEEMLNLGSGGTMSSSQLASLRNSLNEPSPHLFPFLSKRLAQSKAADTSDIDVANALMLMRRSSASRRNPLHTRNGWDLGGGNRVREEDERSRSASPPPELCAEIEKRLLRQKLKATRCQSPIVCTPNPAVDHEYCVTDDLIQAALLLSPSSSDIDDDYDFDNDNLSDDDDDDDDELKTADDIKQEPEESAVNEEDEAVTLTPPMSRRTRVKASPDVPRRRRHRASRRSESQQTSPLNLSLRRGPGVGSPSSTGEGVGVGGRRRVGRPKVGGPPRAGGPSREGGHERIRGHMVGCGEDEDAIAGAGALLNLARLSGAGLEGRGQGRGDDGGVGGGREKRKVRGTEKAREIQKEKERKRQRALWREIDEEISMVRKKGGKEDEETQSPRGATQSPRGVKRRKQVLTERCIDDVLPSDLTIATITTTTTTTTNGNKKRAISNINNNNNNGSAAKRLRRNKNDKKSAKNNAVLEAVATKAKNMNKKSNISPSSGKKMSSMRKQPISDKVNNVRSGQQREGLELESARRTRRKQYAPVRMNLRNTINISSAAREVGLNMRGGGKGVNQQGVEDNQLKTEVEDEEEDVGVGKIIGEVKVKDEPVDE